MTLEQHDAEAKASASMEHATDLRTRLLAELDALERNLRSVRATAEALPENANSTSLDTTQETRKHWSLWKH